MTQHPSQGDWGQLWIFWPGLPLQVLRTHFFIVNMHLLRVVLKSQNNHGHQHLELSKAEYTFGRLVSDAAPATLDVHWDSCTVSKRQFTLFRNGSIPCLMDTSSNGTLVDNELISNQMTPLKNGSEIHVKWDIYCVYLSDDTSPANLERYIDDRFYVLQNYTLGKGNFATVYVGLDTKTGDRLACKILNIPPPSSLAPHPQGKKRKRLENQNASSSGLPTPLAQEISILKCLKHPNVVQVRHVSFSPKKGTVYIFLERVLGGELFDYIVQRQGVKEHEAKFLFYQILKGVKYLHDRNITHRDLKPENLLLESADAFSRVLITDFGMAKMTQSPLERMQTRCGTLDYVAPEVMRPLTTKMTASSLENEQGGYSKQVDIWSLGVILFAMLSGHLPFEPHPANAKVVQVRTSVEIDFPEDQGWDDISSEVKDLIGKLLQIDPSRRPTVSQILDHPWLSDQKVTLSKLYAKVLMKSGFLSASDSGEQ